MAGLRFGDGFDPGSASTELHYWLDATDSSTEYSSFFNAGSTFLQLPSYAKSYGMSVRCIQD